MPWKENTTMSLREEFVAAVGQEGANISAACCAYGISRKTGYNRLKHSIGSMEPRGCRISHDARVTAQLRRRNRWRV